MYMHMFDLWLAAEAMPMVTNTIKVMLASQQRDHQCRYNASTGLPYTLCMPVMAAL